MHILITGGTGFIGSALVPEFLKRGFSVTVLSRYEQPCARRRIVCAVIRRDAISS